MPTAASSLSRRLGVYRPLLVSLVPYLLVPALFLVGVVKIDGYGTRSSVVSLLVLSSLLGLASVGQTLAVIGGGIDLSIPAVIGMGNVMFTQFYGRGWPFWVCALVIAGFAILVGAVNAVASVLLRVHPLLVSLGVGLIVTGGVLSWTSLAYTGAVPGWLQTSMSVIKHTGPIPLPGVVVVWLVVAVAVIVFQRWTRIGREIYARGANPVAARLAGIRSTVALVVAFVISALFAAMVGIFYAGYTPTADIAVGQPYFFLTITAVVVGGTSLLGGSGGYGRTIAGALIISQMTTLLIGFGYGSSIQQSFLGVLIILLVILYGREPRVSTTV
ncbi:MAG: ABC transporter permease [Gaiellales bacterium]